MADLRRYGEALGLRNVATFIASGNLIFDVAAGADLAALERRLEKHLASEFGFEAPAFIRTADEIAAVAETQLFPDLAATDSLYVSFLRSVPDEAAKKAILALESPVDTFRFLGRELYWRCRGKISEVSIAWPMLDKLAKSGKAVDGTSRNITSVRKLLVAMETPARSGVRKKTPRARSSDA